MAAAFQHGLLWEICLDKEQVSYVFGTMHARDARAFQWLPFLTDLILKSKGFYAELDLSDPMAASLDPYMPFDQSISDFVPKARWKRAKHFILKRYGISLEDLDHLYPLFVLQTLTNSQLNDDHGQILDLTLFNVAKESGIPVSGLESWEEQMSLMQKIPIKAQISYLFSAIRHHKSFVRSLQKLVADYQEQRIGALYKRTRNNLGKLRRPMLFDRNSIMADRIEEIHMAVPGQFFTLGAAHLAGKKGVLTLIKKKGFRIHTVPMQE